jgi:exosortase/archaeosortase family protein
VLDLVGVEHLMEGNVLRLSSKQLLVDEACSGIVSILSVVACAVIFAVVKNRAWLHLALLAVAGVFWATMINVARIAAIAWVFDRWQVDWSVGTPHEVLSLALFLVTCLMLLSTDRILQVGLEPVSDSWRALYADQLQFGRRLAAAWDRATLWGAPQAAGDDAAAAGAPQSRPRSQGRSRAIVACFLPLAALQAGLFIQSLRASPANSAAVLRATQASVNLLPRTLVGLHRTGFQAQQRSLDNMHGMYSRTYTYGGEGEPYVVSLDFPFSGGWHELSECYIATGWEPVERRVLSPEANGDERRAWPYVEASFKKPTAGHGIAAFAEFDQYGDPIAPHDGWRRPRDSYLRMRNYYLEDRKTFQVQVWLATAAPATDLQRQRAAKLLLQVREHARTLVTERSLEVERVR